MSRGLGFHGRENALSFSFIKVVFTLIILNKEFKNTRYRVCVIKVDCCWDIAMFFLGIDIIKSTDHEKLQKELASCDVIG